MDNDIMLEKLKEQINSAFKDVKYPGDDKIASKGWYLEDEQLDGYVGRDREDVTVDFINDGHRVCTGFMTDEAFCYYLPTFLILCSEAAYDMDVFSEMIIGKLMLPLKEDNERLFKGLRENNISCDEAGIYPKNESEIQYDQFKFLSFVKMLSIEQREAIYSFLVFYENKYRDGSAGVALRRFWNDLRKQDFNLG